MVEVALDWQCEVRQLIIGQRRVHKRKKEGKLDMDSMVGGGSCRGLRGRCI